MSKNVSRRRTSRRGVRKLVAVPAVAAAIAVPFAIGMQSAGAADSTHTQSLVFKTPSGKTISCGLTQHVVTHYKLNDVVFGESTVSGTADECKTGLNVYQSASWTDPDGNYASSNIEGGQ